MSSIVQMLRASLSETNYYQYMVFEEDIHRADVIRELMLERDGHTCLCRNAQCANRLDIYVQY